MRPEDEALLARVPERRRDVVKAALDELQQIRESYGEVRDDQLPADVRERGYAAMRVVQRETGQRESWVLALVGALLVAVAVAVGLFAPSTFYTCSPAGNGLARCVVRERALGLVPLRLEVLPPVAAASGEKRRETRDTADSQGRRKSQRVTVQRLSLQNERGTSLHEKSLTFGLGASLPELAERIEALARGEEKALVVRWLSVWPALLLATLFGFVGIVMIWQPLSGRLRWSGAAPLRWLSGTVAERALHLVLVSVVASAWGIALAGGAPPEWLVSLLRLGP